MRVGLAERLIEAGRYDSAARAISTALGRFPGNGTLKNKQILVKSILEEQQFMKQREKDRNVGRRSQAAVRMDGIKCQQHNGTSALAACDRLIGDNPRDRKAHARKSLLLAKMGRTRQAKSAIAAARRAGTSSSALRPAERLLASSGSAGSEATSTQEQTSPDASRAQRELVFDAQTGAFALR